MSIFRRLESEVRGYCRSFPKVFSRARGAILEAEDGERYLDFLAGAGTLNYGHNPPQLKSKVIDYLENDGIVHGLDLHTTAKREFLETFERTILWPLELDYKAQFTGPTGTDAVEAALKLARNITGRTNVIAFTNGFHGMTLGAAAASGNQTFRESSGVPLGNVTFMPYDGYFGDEVNTLDYLRKSLEDSSSGVDRPAAVIVETIQGEGGVNVASHDWLRGLERLCREMDILLIVDDIQAGCGRTGTFFSFEEAAICPDIVTVSKSLGGYGLPMSLVLMRSDLDQWKPGEHTGTFRGNNLAFVAATQALKLYWSDSQLTDRVKANEKVIGERLRAIADRHADTVSLEVRGRGMFWGIGCSGCPELADAVSGEAFKRKLVIETCGSEDHVLKLLPTLVIEDELLEQGLQTIEQSFEQVLNDRGFLEKHDLKEVSQ
jgi:diaminobutyrate-2-oxoglutarate transaminase